MGKKETTKFIVQLIVSIASAILTAFEQLLHLINNI